MTKTANTGDQITRQCGCGAHFDTTDPYELDCAAHRACDSMGAGLHVGDDPADALPAAHDAWIARR